MLLFEIHSIPRPQKQTRWSKQGAYDPSKQYKDTLRWQIMPHAPQEPLQGPVSVHITFYMPIPKETSNFRRQRMLNGLIHHVVRPDIDNLAYIVINAMKELIYDDDKQVVDLILSKRYGEVPKTVIKVCQIDVASNYTHT